MSHNNPTATATEECLCRSQHQCHAKGSCDFVGKLMYLTLGFSLITAALGILAYCCLRRFHVRRYRYMFDKDKEADPTDEIGLELLQQEDKPRARKKRRRQRRQRRRDDNGDEEDLNDEEEEEGDSDSESSATSSSTSEEQMKSDDELLKQNNSGSEPETKEMVDGDNHTAEAATSTTRRPRPRGVRKT